MWRKNLRVSAEYATIEEELEAALRRVFNRTPTPDVIFVDDKRHIFLLEAIAYGVERGWLTAKMNEIEEQYSLGGLI
jgi:hypothetical protein